MQTPPISICANQLNLGDLTINTDNAELWSPRPDWETLHAKRDDILNQIMSLRGQWSSARSNPLTDLEIASSVFDFAALRSDLIAMTSPFIKHQPFDKLRAASPISNSLISALINADLTSSITAAQKLAGLGIGLTPAGDDFILGAIHAAWIIHPPEIARVLTEEITDIAAPLTTSLSAAWLKAAGNGEAGILWHNFFDALISGGTIAIQEAAEKILEIGHTSGADSLAGFVNTLQAFGNMR